MQSLTDSRLSPESRVVQGPAPPVMYDRGILQKKGPGRAAGQKGKGLHLLHLDWARLQWGVQQCNPPPMDAVLDFLAHSPCRLRLDTAEDDPSAADSPSWPPGQRRGILAQQAAAPGRFLAGYGVHLSPALLLPAFQPLAAADFEVSIVLQRLVAAHARKIQEAPARDRRLVQVRNRRFRRLQVLLTEGEYFSDESLQQRDLHLFQLFVGQYMSAEEKSHRDAELKCVFLVGFGGCVLPKAPTTLPHVRILCVCVFFSPAAVCCLPPCCACTISTRLPSTRSCPTTF